MPENNRGFGFGGSNNGCECLWIIIFIILIFSCCGNNNNGGCGCC